MPSIFHSPRGFVEPAGRGIMAGMRRWLWPVSFFCCCAHAVTVAVIDTGFDLDHEALRPRLRLGETDEEGALSLPGFGAWSFQDNTHLKSSAIEPALLQEILLYRSLKAKSHQQGLSPDERLWLEQRKQDAQFRERLKLFKRHTHGTIVAGILLSEGEGLEIFPVRGLGIDVPTLMVESPADSAPPVVKHSQSEFYAQVKLSQDRVIRKMSKMLAWIHHHDIRVVNGSYGVSEKHILRRFGEWHKEITGLELAPEKLKEVVDGYFSALYRRADRILARYPNTLFIFSAGNSQQDNDQHHHFPSRLRRDHVIAVAATNGEQLASFSNWGQHNVDVGAPGVGVASLLPSVYRKESGVTSTVASGTSMAAPMVSNLAARCLQINPLLSAAQLKTLLLQTGTGVFDLVDKSVSGRVVSPQRALKAAQFSLITPLDEAIRLANNDLVPSTPSSPSSSSPDPVSGSPDSSSPPAAAPSAVPETAPAPPTESSP